MKEEKGITLIALVFTIIVIMILASIAVYSGVSTLKYSRFNKAKNELEIMQTYVNEWYREYKNVVVKDDEVLPGQTREEIRAVRQSEIIKKYGETTAVSSCNQDTLRSTLLVFLTETELANELALDPENRDYRFFSESYLKTNFGMNASYDFLVNIPTRTVILFGGLIYNGKIYFTPEQFGLLNVLTTEMKGITFNVSQGKRKEVIISDVKLKDNTSRESDISKFIVQYKKESENIWKTVKPSDLTKFTETTEVDGQNITTTKYKFLVEEYTDYHIKVTSQDKNLDGVYTITLEPGRGIKVGDYITYTSPTESVTFNDAETGYSGYATNLAPLERKTLFRVMDIDAEGNITLVGAMTSSDTTIYFSGAKGYNNVVYTLNKKCGDLYKDDSRGITARSIKVEDIIDKFNQTGKDKLTNYIDTKLSSLTTGSYVTNVDIENRKVTYQTRTYYPDIFKYEEGGLLGSIATTGEIRQSEIYSGYEGLTANGAAVTSSTRPASLTAPYTFYNTSHEATDFDNTNGYASAYQNMFFESGTYYWLATRCIYCSASRANFIVRAVWYSSFGAIGLYSSDNTADSGSDYYSGRVCPIVYIPNSVGITVSTDTSEYHQTVPHIVD